MALISGATIIRSLALFHLTIAFFFLTSPKTVSDQTLVFVIGEAMKLPTSRTFETPSAPLSFAAALLILVAVSDLTSISMPEEHSLYFFGAQAPVRLALFFCLAGYSFLFSSNSMLMKNRVANGAIYESSTWGEGLKNRVFFTFAFVEMITWFWVYVTLREERGVMAQKQMAERKRREELEL